MQTLKWAHPLAATIAILLLFASHTAHAQSADGAPERPGSEAEARGDSAVSFVVGGFVDVPVTKPFALPGVRYTAGLSESLALSVELRSLVFISILSTGLNWTVIEGAWAAYLYSRGGGSIVLGGKTGGTATTFEAGAGVEYVSSGGFSLAFESGPIFVFKTSSDNVSAAAALNIALGYRF